jgi:diguanylate cyclase (GGDEF)-like protein/PAS domain S-box-containing protein
MISRLHPNLIVRAGKGFLIGALCALFIFAADSLHFLNNLERGAIDSQFRARGIVYPSPDIVLVEADDAMIARLPLPLPRHVYAEIIDRLTRAGAKTIAFDVFFPSVSGSPAEDRALIEATRKSGRVVHSAAFNFSPSIDPSLSVDTEGNATKILPRFRVPNQNVDLPETLWGSAAFAALQKEAAGLGHVNAPPEDDGVLRRIPNLLRFRSGQKPVLYPSLALAAAAHFLDVKPSQIEVKEHEIVLPAPSGTRHIPLDNYGNTWVNWIGPHHSFVTHSFTTLLDGKVSDDQFKGKVVLVGLTSAGSFERHATPFSSVQPAVELQANALDDILMRRSARASSDGLRMLLLLAFPALIGAVAFLWNVRSSGLLGLALCAALWFASIFSLSHFALILPVATPLLASLLSWSVCIAFRQFADARQLRQAEERYALAVRGANDGIWDWNLATGEIYFSPRWKAMLGYGEGEIEPTIESWYQLVHAEDLSRMKAQIERHLSGEALYFESQHQMKHRNGSILWVLTRGLRVDGPDGKPTRMAGSQSDITLQVETSRQLERNAFYDGLTGLPNRALFMNVLDRALARAHRRGEHSFAVLFLDLDRFKTVNDSLGHSSGDDLLVQVARRIEGCLRAGDTAARLGGDEFTILLDEIEDASDATRIAERIQSELKRPFSLAGHEVFPSSSIGIALSTPVYEYGEDLLRDADTAMYRAKSQGRAHHAVFDEAMHAHSLALLRLETDLRRALERENFLVYYQPIVDLQSGELRGFEALVRWKHPEKGMISPGDFIPLAEETGLIIPLDHLVLREACTQVHHWQSVFSLPLTISVNLSSKQFAQSDLVGQIQQTLADTGLAPRSLKLEITEGVLMDNPETAATMLHQLRELGIRLSIDDFGTGYSSLSYLHRFPLDTLKVDQSFVRRMNAEGENAEIVRTIVALARNLNMDVIAEGIETQVQMEQLREMQCESGQGYFFSRPLPAAEAESLLLKGARWQTAPLDSHSLDSALAAIE